MKKLSVLFAFLLVFSSILQASAAEFPMDDLEYEDQVASILASYTDDPDAAKQALAELDTVLLSEPTVVECREGNPYTRGTSPSDYEFTVSSFKRSNSTRIYMQWILTANSYELSVGPLDFVSLEWDTAYGSYYLSSAGGDGCTVQGRDTGIVLFNVEDDKLFSGDYVYGTVQVEPLTTGWMAFGSKFVHTYTSYNVTGSATHSYISSASVSADGGSLGLSYTKTYTVNVDSETSQWQRWVDNAVNIYET